MVRTATSYKEIQFFIDLGKDIGWSINDNYDAQRLYSADNDGVYIGELEGEKISSVIMAMHGKKELCHIGLFVVKPEFRGKGYGSKTWEYAWSKIPESCYASLCTAVTNMALKYEARYGFKIAWKEFTYMCSAEKIAALPSSSLNFTTKSHREVDFNSLVQYDASVFGYERESFLTTLLAIPSNEGWVAFNQDGKLIGYLNLLREKGKLSWYVAPLYANNVSIACDLLKKAAQYVLQEGCDATLVISVPEVNEAAMNLVQPVSMEVLFEYVRMFARATPEIIEKNVVKSRRVFSISSKDTG